MRDGTLEPVIPWWCDWQTPPLSIDLKSYSLSCPQAAGHIRECQCSRGRTMTVCVSFTRAPVSMFWLETPRCDRLRVGAHKPKIAQGWSEVVWGHTFKPEVKSFTTELEKRGVRVRLHNPKCVTVVRNGGVLLSRTYCLFISGADPTPKIKMSVFQLYLIYSFP